MRCQEHWHPHRATPSPAAAHGRDLACRPTARDGSLRGHEPPLCRFALHCNWRRIEPYSLRRSSSGRLLLHAERSDGSGHRTYGIDAIGGIRTITTPFRPRYPVEFSEHGPLHAPSRSRTSRSRATTTGLTRTPTRVGPVYVYQCARCGKELRHPKRDATLRAHKDRHGRPCSGRRGVYIGTR